MTKERDRLLNRLLHAYSGYGLDQPVPSYADAQATTKAPNSDEVIGRGTHSNIDLLQELENAALRVDTGIPDITVAASRARAQEDFETAAKEYEDNLIKARTRMAAESGIRDVV